MAGTDLQRRGARTAAACGWTRATPRFSGATRTGAPLSSTAATKKASRTTSYGYRHSSSVNDEGQRMVKTTQRTKTARNSGPGPRTRGRAGARTASWLAGLLQKSLVEPTEADKNLLPDFVALHGAAREDQPGGRVYDAKGRTYGAILCAGGGRCATEGCSGRVLRVRWADGKTTRCCLRGLRVRDDGHLQIRGAPTKSVAARPRGVQVGARRCQVTRTRGKQT